MTQYLFTTGAVAAYAVVALIFCLINKVIADGRIRGARSAGEWITESNNLALALRYAGIFVAIAVGLAGSLSGAGGSHGFWQDLKTLVVDGVWITVFLLLAQYINDRLIVPGLDNTSALVSGNTAVGWTEFGSLVATGLIAYGSFSGGNGNGGGTASYMVAAAFFFLGQAALVGIVYAYRLFAGFAVVDEVKRGNTSAGLMLAGLMVSLGLILKTSISGKFTGWAGDLQAFVVSAVSGIVLLFLLQFLIDFLLLPKTTLREEIERDGNAAALTVGATAQVALAIVLSTLI